MKTPNRISIFLGFVLFLLLLFSCRGRNDEQTLQEAASLSDTLPEKTLKLLETIITPEELKKASYMKYITLYIQAKAQLHRDIINDTLIFQAQDYFTKQGGLEYAGLSNYFAGRVYFEQAIYDQSLKSYLQSLYWSGKSDNKKLSGKNYNNIGDLYATQDMMDSALVNYRRALKSYNESKDFIYNTSTLRNIGSLYLDNNQMDSAEYYFKEGLQLSQKTSDKQNRAVFLQGLGILERYKKGFKKSSLYFHKALDYYNLPTDSLRVYLSLALLYKETAQTDSMQYYAGLLEAKVSHIKYPPTLIGAYEVLSDYNKQVDNYQIAMRYQELKDDLKLKLQDAGNKHKLEKAILHFNTLVLNKELEKRKIITFSCGVLILFLILLLIVGQRLNRNKMKLLKTENDLLNQRSVNLGMILNRYDKMIEYLGHLDHKIGWEKLGEKNVAPDWLKGTIKNTLRDLKSDTDSEFTEWAKMELLKSHPRGNNALLSLSSEDIRIFYFIVLGYSSKEISLIEDISDDEDEFALRVCMIRNKLIAAGIDGKTIMLQYS